MQLASHGARETSRKVSSLLTHPPGARAIHVFAHAKPKAPLPNKPVHRFVSGARTLLGHFFTQLTTPGLRAPVPSYSRSLHAARLQPLRQAASPLLGSAARSAKGPFLPRPPQAAPPCSVNNVGLGAARKFSTARPIFQALTENVPVVGRSFYEADWDIKTRKQRANARKFLAAQVLQKGKAVMKVKAQPTAPMKKLPSREDEADLYFKYPTSEVTTSLFIPLAPTPTARTPLPQGIADRQALLPLAELAELHNHHELHSLKVSALFQRLDAANVWEHGVQCEAYAHRAGLDGICTILRVQFSGWSKAEVRSIIGESGTGWCSLEEDIHGKVTDDVDSGSEISDILSEYSGISGMSTPPDFDSEPEMELPPQLDASSFVLPTLNFSSAFPSTSTYQASVPAPDPFPDSISEAWSDTSVDSKDSWYGFSSDFASRISA